MNAITVAFDSVLLAVETVCRIAKFTVQRSLTDAVKSTDQSLRSRAKMKFHVEANGSQVHGVRLASPESVTELFYIWLFAFVVIGFNASIYYTFCI